VRTRIALAKICTHDCLSFTINLCGWHCSRGIRAEQRNIPQDRTNVNNDPPIGNDARLLCRTDCSSPGRCPRLALDDRFRARSFDATTTSMVFALIYLMFSAYDRRIRPLHV